jgi:hypothetical protein
VTEDLFSMSTTEMKLALPEVIHSLKGNSSIFIDSDIIRQLDLCIISALLILALTVVYSNIGHRIRNRGLVAHFF